ncbi:DUF4913 domain-containing protein [Rhodococcus erythropolis]|uniref:DUF4913 domain-containing protein n=1 Tax=Rhodococcus erythropolis (strain PR4 / NBRC 100887) TaxID=234621 RepID=Q3L944_RHOE4|nr:DUF4913 domain-containing protein [Rhodococcus erythropolis]BAE46269.1 conserved hypothetical protein [Rhodococcus erythropolis PR4]
MVDFATAADDWSAADDTNYEDPSDYAVEESEPDVGDDEGVGAGWDVPDEPDADTADAVEAADDDSQGPDLSDPEPMDFSDPALYGGTAIVGEEDVPEIEPQFANVIEFVEQFFTQVIRRKMGLGGGNGGNVWDPRWALYPEVAGRLKALWFAYEEARASDKPSAMSAWWIQHFDAHFRVICDGDNGPMSDATADGSWMGHPALKYEPVPRELLDDLLDERAED